MLHEKGQEDRIPLKDRGLANMQGLQERESVIFGHLRCLMNSLHSSPQTAGSHGQYSSTVLLVRLSKARWGQGCLWEVPR